MARHGEQVDLPQQRVLCLVAARVLCLEQVDTPAGQTQEPPLLLSQVREEALITAHIQDHLPVRLQATKR